MYGVCAFTGHRALSGTDFDTALLDRVVFNLIKNGVRDFFCGMALGFDTAAAETVLNFKRNYKIKLTACLPCPEQAEKFSSAAKERYERILKSCDRVIILSEEYYEGCMHARDRFLAESCCVLVSFLRKKSGGTFYTVNFAKKLGKKIIEL